jgi:hypothetical protein
MMPWQPAAVVAAVLIAVGVLAGAWARGQRSVAATAGAARRGSGLVERAAPFAREAGFVFALYALWQFAGGVSIMNTARGVRRGLWIWQHERSWHFPSEAALQRQILPHPLLVQLCNLYYVSMHFGFLIALLIWLFVLHRADYPRIRTTIVIVTLACLLIQLIPVAPPRLIHVGMVDTAVKYGQSVYAVGGLGSDQFSAMPSVHVAWATIVAFAVITVSKSRWRWLILLHTVITVYVVVVTANHYWSDGLVAVALIAISLALQWAARPRYERLRRRRSEKRSTRPVLDEPESRVLTIDS